ncbi:MAG TPA: DUF3147 family protein [Candidatus Eisenbacteria bacterium]|jgi:hypothetical protein|nr:DUF3147 family protein [Candidatus Eisenbacteria bacterium]
MLTLAKLLISAAVIAGASHLAGRRPVLAGFIVALPLVSILSLTFAWIEHRDMEKVSRFAVSILGAVPLSLTFFLPFFAHRWLKWDFAPTMAAAFGCLGVSYGAAFLLLRK